MNPEYSISQVPPNTLQGLRCIIVLGSTLGPFDVPTKPSGLTLMCMAPCIFVTYLCCKIASNAGSCSSRIVAAKHNTWSAEIVQIFMNTAMQVAVLRHLQLEASGFQGKPLALVLAKSVSS